MSVYHRSIFQICILKFASLSFRVKKRAGVKIKTFLSTYNFFKRSIRCIDAHEDDELFHKKNVGFTRLAATL